MRFRIHRAADEIGGNCVEVQEGGRSILLDLGLPLVAGRPDPMFLPKVDGLSDGGNPDLLGVIVSHPHQDHYGLLSCAHPSIPVHMGSRARKLLAAAEFFTPISSIPQPTFGYGDRATFTIGPFTITPFEVDHSAFDSYALLIEAGGKRLFYSGDFRLHGEPVLANSLIASPPAAVDVLLMEGTVLGRTGEGEERTEADLQQDLATAMRTSEHVVLSCFSPQNISRLATVLRATRESQRTLVVDVYTAQILRASAGPGVPEITAGDIRVFLPSRQKRQIVRAKRFDLVSPFRRQRIYLEELAATPKAWTVLFRASMFDDFEEMDLRGGKLLYSLWPGYLERDEGALRAWANRKGLGLEVHHTSGHAYVNDLRRFVAAIAPRRLVPLHTLHPHRYPSLFPNVEVVPNLAWTDV